MKRKSGVRPWIPPTRFPPQVHTWFKCFVSSREAWTHQSKSTRRVTRALHTTWGTPRRFFKDNRNSSACAGTPCFIALRRCCICYKLKAIPSTTSTRDDDSLYGDTPFIGVAWTQTHNISEVCLSICKFMPVFDYSLMETRYDMMWCDKVWYVLMWCDMIRSESIY